MSATKRSLIAAVVAACLTGGGYGIAAASGRGQAALLGPSDATVQFDVEYSRFEPSKLRVVEGTQVRLVLNNRDPIGHELIVGPPDVHARHASGTHGKHPAVPGEVSVPPNQQASTVYRFDEPGTVEFACHLPGHYEYGMRGEIEVVPAS